MAASTILLFLIWGLIILYTIGAFLTLCNAVRYRDVMVQLDAERIAHQPFQPRISIVIRCDLKSTRECVSKIQESISLNYNQYEVILIVDSTMNRQAFDEIIGYFDLRSLPVPKALNELWNPPCGYYRSPSSLYKRLTVIDKKYYRKDDLRYTGAAVCRVDYMLFVRSLDNDLIRNSLANLAIMKMRNSRGQVTTIRGAARYNCGKTLSGNFFRTLADLCNIRRLYVCGGLKGNDFGQFVILEDISGRKGKEELVPQPQMYLNRPNHFRTYMLQLAPGVRYNTGLGKAVSYMELLIGLVFWASGVHVFTTQGVVNNDFLFMLTALMLPLVASTFSVFVGEIFLKENFSIRFVLRLLALSFLETLIFCIFLPWVWVLNKLFKYQDT